MVRHYDCLVLKYLLWFNRVLKPFLFIVSIFNFNFPQIPLNPLRPIFSELNRNFGSHPLRPKSSEEIWGGGASNRDFTAL